jgi:hypothetical protein
MLINIAADQSGWMILLFDVLFRSCNLLAGHKAVEQRSLSNQGTRTSYFQLRGSSTVTSPLLATYLPEERFRRCLTRPY